MNGQAAKLERRDLRRTLGQTGLLLVERQGAALEQSVMPALNALHTVAQDSDKRLTELEAFRHRSLRDRLAWVLFGD